MEETNEKYTNPVLNERDKTHGDWGQTAYVNALLLKALGSFQAELTASQCSALYMICMKMARIVSGNANEPDHWKDIAGYAELALKHLERGES